MEEHTTSPLLIQSQLGNKWSRSQGQISLLLQPRSWWLNGPTALLMKVVAEWRCSLGPSVVVRGKTSSQEKVWAEASDQFDQTGGPICMWCGEASYAEWSSQGRALNRKQGGLAPGWEWSAFMGKSPSISVLCNSMGMAALWDTGLHEANIQQGRFFKHCQQVQSVPS